MGLSPSGLRLLVLRAGFWGCQAPVGLELGLACKKERKKKKTCIGRCLC